MNRGRAIALLAVGCALAAGAAGSGPYLTKHGDEHPTAALIRTAARERQRRFLERGPGRARSMTTFEAVVEWVFLGVLVLAVLYGLYRAFLAVAHVVSLLRLRGSGGMVSTGGYDPGEESYDDAKTVLRDRVRGELSTLSAELDDVPDPREAVIVCYLRMERAFASAGAARRADESPMELLARVLDELYVPEHDVRRLTELFAEARFSTHPVSDEMREAARRSLDGIARALAVPA